MKYSQGILSAIDSVSYVFLPLNAPGHEANTLKLAHTSMLNFSKNLYNDERSPL